MQPLATSSGLALISRLRPVSYNWADRSRGADLQMGLVAQEVQKAIPTLVTNSGIISKSTPDGMLAVNYAGLITPIVLAIQQLDVRTQSPR